MSLPAFLDPMQANHDPEFFLVRGLPTSSADQPERLDRLRSGLEQVGAAVEAPADFGLEPVAAVHTARYLDYLRVAHDQWGALDGAKASEVVANIHPCRSPAGYPRSIVGRAGWHSADTACPIGPDTYAAALASANTALAAAAAVAGGSRFAYGLCRPSGHHAFADMAGGFCFLNNTAIAAQWLRSSAGGGADGTAVRRRGRVAVLDIDVHHGNGTQDIFYHRRDVLTVSIHRHPADYYPFFWGYTDQTGADEGEGYNVNLPLPAGSGDAEFLAAVDAALAQVVDFGPDHLVVALGLDASEHDPLRGLKVTTPGFERVARAIGGVGLPTVLVQEGGYLSDALGPNLASFLTGMLAAL